MCWRERSRINRNEDKASWACRNRNSNCQFRSQFTSKRDAILRTGHDANARDETYTSRFRLAVFSLQLQNIESTKSFLLESQSMASFVENQGCRTTTIPLPFCWNSCCAITTLQTSHFCLWSSCIPTQVLDCSHLTPSGPAKLSSTFRHGIGRISMRMLPVHCPYTFLFAVRLITVTAFIEEVSSIH